MNDVNLISVNDVKENTTISKNILPEFVEPYIMIAEQFYVYEILGAALVTELKDQITGSTVTSLNNTLLRQYIKPVVCWGVLFENLSSPYKVMNKGVVKQSDPNSESTSTDELAFQRQNHKDKILFFSNRLQKYLEDNRDSYPLYRSSTCCNEKNHNYFGGIYLGPNN